MKDLIKSVACIGAGVMGHGWATLFSMKGYSVCIQSRHNDTLKKALGLIREELNLLAEKGMIDKLEAETAFKRIRPTTNIYEAVSEADYIQEAVLDEMDVKKRVFKEIDKAASHEAILASSGTLSMTEIQKETMHPERCIIVHGSCPPFLIPLIEIVPGKVTSENTIEKVYKFMKHIGKNPIISHEEQKLIHHRLQKAISDEIAKLVDEGVAIEDVDSVLKSGPSLRWALMGEIITLYSNGDLREPTKPIHFKMLEALKEIDFVKRKSFNEILRWRDSKLVDLMRTLEWIMI